MFKVFPVTMGDGAKCKTCFRNPRMSVDLDLDLASAENHFMEEDKKKNVDEDDAVLVSIFRLVFVEC